MTSTDEIENYPGFPDGIPGMDLSMKMAEQARKFGTEIISATVEHVRLEPDIKELNFGRDSLYGPNVLVCFGTEHRHIGIPGEEEYYGKGVSYCATCDGPLYRDKEMFVIGGGDSAIRRASTFPISVRR
ncbi:MAG: hypothetical protein U5N86_11885 [Planctomycetota bacterium]|nr:hypothetical protein [Planctomycetota bacterium]